MPLILPATFREHYPALVGTASDTLVASMISRAEGLVALYCHYPLKADGTRTLEESDYVLYPRPRGKGDPRTLCLCVRPITAVTAVFVDADRAYGASTEIVEGVDFDVDTLAGAISLLPGGSLAYWSSDIRANRVEVTAGYATCPPELEVILAQATRHLWDLRANSRDTTDTFDKFSAERRDLDALLPEAVRAALDLGFVVRC